MNERITGADIGKIYDRQATEYSHFAEESYTWRFIEKPAFDKYIPDFYKPETRVIDVGCGEGRVIRHLIDRGIRPENIVGVDPSEELIKIAQSKSPGVKFIVSPFEEVDLPANSFDLATSNMVFHHMDVSTMIDAVDNLYKLMVPSGKLFVVDTHTLHDKTYEQGIINDWVEQMTPWGTKTYSYNRHPMTNFDIYDIFGFDWNGGTINEPLPVSDEGRVDPVRFERYTTHPSRVANRYVRTPEEIRDSRLRGDEIPHLPSGEYSSIFTDEYVPGGIK